MNSLAHSDGKTRVFIVDDHPVTRQGLAFLINQQKDLIVCGEAPTAALALELLPASHPHLILVDITLPDKPGIELIKDIKVMYPELPVLVVSMHKESLYAERSLRAGARGYIMKDKGGDGIVKAIRRVLDGQIYLSEAMSTHLLEHLSGGHKPSERSGIEHLSDREFELFKLIGDGLSTHEIAERLHLSPKTVDAHRANIKDKLNFHSAAELVSYAARWTAQEQASGGDRGSASLPV